MEARIGSLALEARLRDGLPKFRNAAKKFKAKQNKATEERLRATVFLSSAKLYLLCL